MKVVVLGGAGIVGRAIAADLARDVEQLIVADRDSEAARQAAAAAGPSVTAAGVDARDSAAMGAVLLGADACVNSVNYYFNLDVMRACLEAGVPYLDLGGLFHMTRKQLELHPEFVAKGVTAVLGIGSCPGVSNVQAGWLAAMLDSVEAVRIFNGSLSDPGDSLSFPYALQTILDEIGLAGTEPIQVDGVFVRPRQLLLELIARRPEPHKTPSDKDFKAVVTEVRGRSGGEEVQLRAETTGGRAAASPLSAGSRLIAGPAAIVARWLARRRLDRPGVWPPEQAIDPHPFFDELAQRGFTTRLSRSEAVAVARPDAALSS